MPEIKKIDFRNIGDKDPSQPEDSKEEKSKNGFSFDGSFVFWEKMTKKAKIEAAVLAIILLITAGLLAFYFLNL